MNRRDFLLFRTVPTGRTLELSCRRLYMHHVDAERSAQRKPPPSTLDHEPWMGEPEAVFTRPVEATLVGQIEDDLNRADVLRVLEREWLAPTGLGGQIESLLDAFRARGGRVEFISNLR